MSPVLPVAALNTHRLNVIPVKMEGKSLNYTVLIEQDEDGIYIAKVSDIPGCYTQGKTVEQAMECIREAIQVCLEAEKLEYITGGAIGEFEESWAGNIIKK